MKQVIEGRLATEDVKQFDWITAVNGTPITRVKESEEMVQLTKNDGSEVRLTIRRAIGPLKNIRNWSSKEKDVTLDVCPKDLGFRLSHFYSKVKLSQINLSQHNFYFVDPVYMYRPVQVQLVHVILLFVINKYSKPIF